MHYQENKAGGWIALAVSLPLACFTIWRAWDLMSAILPADQSVAAWFGIAALDGGMVAWVFGYLKAQSSDQRRVAGIMAFLDFAGVGAVTYLDLNLAAWHKGLIAAPTDLFMEAIIIISVSVLLNVGTGWLYVVNDPKKKQEIRDQKAHDKINDLADAQIEQHAAMYAPQFAQVKVETWLMQARMLHGINQPFQQIQQSPTVQGTGMALPSASEPTQQPATQPQTGGFFGRVKNVFNPQVPAAQPVPQPAPSSTPVQPNVDQRTTQQDLQDWVSVWMRSTDQQNGMPFLTWLEDLGTEHVKDETMALARRLYPVKAQSPLQQPQLDTNKASQPGTNGH